MQSGCVYWSVLSRPRPAPPRPAPHHSVQHQLTGAIVVFFTPGRPR